MTHAVTEPALSTPTQDAVDDVRQWLQTVPEPFPGVRAVFDDEGSRFVTTGRLGSPTSSFEVYSALRELASGPVASGRDGTLVAVFAGPLPPTERSFEDRLWLTLQHLSDFDERAWTDSLVSALEETDYSFAVDGDVWFVEVMHPLASDASRCAPWPVLVIQPVHAGPR